MTTAYGLPCWELDWASQLGWGGGYVSDIASHYSLGLPFWASDLAGRSDYTPMTVTVPDGDQGTPGSAVEFSVTVSVSGGTGSYTAFNWNYAVTSGYAGTVEIYSGQGTSTATFYVDVGWDGSCTFAYNCTVTDSSGASVTSNTPNINIYSYYSPQ